MKYQWEILILFMVLAIASLAMLPLYWLIGKRILSNTPSSTVSVMSVLL